MTSTEGMLSNYRKMDTPSPGLMTPKHGRKDVGIWGAPQRADIGPSRFNAQIPDIPSPMSKLSEARHDNK